MIALMSVALFLSATTPQTGIENPCGIAGSKPLLAFNVYGDKSKRSVRVDQTLALEVHRQDKGPVIIRRMPDGDVLYSMANQEFDGFVRDTASASGDSTIRVETENGSLYIDPASTLGRQGSWIFMCWMPKNAAVLTTERHREIYSGIETDADTGEAVVRRTDGSTLELPSLRNQVEIDALRISPDGQRIGWLVNEPNCCTSYPIPLHLVIFKAGKIEQVFDDEQCIFDWTFARNGKAVAYRMGALHGSDYQTFRLRSLSTGKPLATYFYPDSFDGGNAEAEAKRASAVAAAPRWVTDVPSD